MSLSSIDGADRRVVDSPDDAGKLDDGQPERGATGGMTLGQLHREEQDAMGYSSEGQDLGPSGGLTAAQLEAEERDLDSGPEPEVPDEEVSLRSFQEISSEGEALELLSRSTMERSLMPEVYTTIAEALRKAGKVERAAHYLELADLTDHQLRVEQSLHDIENLLRGGQSKDFGLKL